MAQIERMLPMTLKTGPFHSVGFYWHRLANFETRAWVVFLCWASFLGFALGSDACRMDEVLPYTLLHKKCCQGDPGCNVSQLKMATYCNVGMRCSDISFQIEENAVWACTRLQAMLFHPKHPKSPLRPTACLRRLHLLVPISRHSRLRYLWHLLQKQCWQRSKKQLPTHFHTHTL